MSDDLEAIRQLKARYFRLMDTKDWNSLADVFADEAELELTSSTGIWALEDQIWWPEGSPFSHLHGFGHYHETYEKSDDGWRIATMTITRLHRVLGAATPT